jgi:hypothetical protein
MALELGFFQDFLIPIVSLKIFQLQKGLSSLFSQLLIIIIKSTIKILKLFVLKDGKKSVRAIIHMLLQDLVVDPGAVWESI